MLIFIALMSMQSTTDAAVQSSTGNLIFDVNSDLQAEMTLNSNGLQIGANDMSAHLSVSGNAIISKNLTVGSQTVGSSNLHIHGTMSQSVTSLSSGNFTLSSNCSSIILVDTSAGNTSLTLPYAGNMSGTLLNIKKTSPLHHLWLIGGANLIDRSTELELSSGNYGHTKLISNGADWMILSSSSSQGVATGNLTAHWTFNEGSGNVWSELISNNHLYVNQSSVSVGEGKHGPGARFTGGANITGTAAHHSALNLGTNWSISFWFKANRFPNTFNRLVEKGNDSTGGYSIRFGSSTPDIRFKAAGDNFTSNALTNIFSYTHIVFTYDGTTLTVYENAQFNKSASKTYNPTTTSSFILTGNNDGHLDNLRIYNKVLSNAEISALFSTGL
jgi:hypothetical protein